ncbi:mitochondrial import inner membrane translocase subunit tim21 [Dispira simplex]|nr:mitochondrial import inner membrane translocase subunit tim21 [Dispira simplex]
MARPFPPCLQLHGLVFPRWFNTAKPGPNDATRIVDRAKSGLEVVGNVIILLVGLVIIGGVPYLLFSDLLGNEGHVKWFSDALQRVRHDPNVIKFVGTPIKGYGDSSHSRMARNRQIGYTITHDRRGEEHMLIRFFIEGPVNTGTVKMDLVRNPQHPDTWQYNYLLVEVPGHGLPSWRLVLDTTQPAPPPAWQETALDMYQTISKSVIYGKDLVVGSTLHGYDIVKEWINSRWNK